MPTTDYTQNINANAVTDRTIQVRLHTGDAGNNGTSNTIAGATADVAAAGWSTAAAGDSTNASAIDFGVLSTSDSFNVSHYSCWDGANFMGREALTSPVTVAANETFSINAQTVTWTGSTS